MWPWFSRRRQSNTRRSRRPLRALRSESLEARNYLSAVSLWDPLNQTPVAGVSISTSTGEKPQSKVWEHNDQWWSVLPNSSGTWLWRLDTGSWTPVVQLSSNNGTRADVKVVGNLAHVLMFQGSTSQLVTMEYGVGGSSAYGFWSAQPNVVSVPLGSSVEMATIDVDSAGRMWVAYDRSSTIEVRYSDALYTSFSAPITVASGITSDDISSIIAMPGGKVGVFWSNQNAKQFGFRTHVDGSNPQTWAADEIPASQSAKSKGRGFADDHLHLATSSDGTLYAAVKTGYDASGYESIALLVRRPSGMWDNAYAVDNSGTRPILVISEAHNELAVVYTENTGGGDIVLRGSPLGSIDFGPTQTVLSGNLNDVTGSKANVDDGMLFLATRSGSAVGSLISLGLPGGGGPPTNAAPLVNAGADQSITLPSAANLSGSASDDGLPSGTLGTSWTKVSGPGTVGFGNANAPATTATFGEAGTYVLQLAASDGSLLSSDQLTIQVQTPGKTQQGSDLAGWWSMEAGGADQSGSGNNGTLTGSTATVPGQSGNALRVSGGGRIVVPGNASLDLTQAITLAAWIRPEATGTQYFLAKKASGSTNGYELSLSSSGKIYVRFNEASSGNTYRVDSTTTYPTNGQTWIHVAATYDGSTIKLYINGQLQASKAASFQIGSNNLALGIGAEPNGTRGMTGALDEVRIYSRALTATEISGLLSNVPPPPTNTAPLVNAGADQSITLPGAANLSGSASDDGLPSGTLNASWTKVSGPGTVGFGNANAASTTATFSQAGTYVLQLTASDGSLQSSDQVTIQVQSAPPPPQGDAGLVGWWTMDGNGADQSGQANNGTPAGSASFGPGRISSALLLASSGSRLVVPDSSSLDVTGSITLSAWIRPSASGTQYVMSKNAKGSTDGYELSLSNSGTVFVRFNEASSGDTYRVDSSTKYPTNGQTWIHVAATYDGSTIRMYINGQLQASKTAGFQIDTNDLALTLGSGENGYRGMTGALDDARIYARALSAQEIAALANP